VLLSQAVKVMPVVRGITRTVMVAAAVLVLLGKTQQAPSLVMVGLD
jgi:hypothetical protein